MPIGRLRIGLARLGRLFDRERQDRELAEELESHLAMHIEDNLRAGMTAEEARRQALIKLGGLTQTIEEYRRSRGFPRLEDAWRDLRYAGRMLLKQRSFTLVAVLTLALGIGANTAIFSLVYGVLFRPLPYKDQDRLVQIEGTKEGWPFVGATSYPEFADWKRESHSFEHLVGYNTNPLTVGYGEALEQIRGTYVSNDLFTFLGVAPLLGRTFTAEEVDGKDQVAILSYGYWQRRFGGDPGVIGQSMTIESKDHTIVGVMPADVRFPDSAPANIWLPLSASYQTFQKDRRGWFIVVLGRLKEGLTLEQAQADMDGIAARLEAAYPRENRGRIIKIYPMLERHVDNYRPTLLPLLGAVGFLLLIACANIASLFLARNATRQKEMAIRATLGASRGRLIRQMLTEAMLVALVGGLTGLLMAGSTRNLLIALVPGNVPRLDQVRIDLVVLGFTFGVSVLTGLACGLAPALRSKDVRLSEALKEGDRGAQGGAARQRLHGALIVAEVALAVVLLIGAGLMLKSFARLMYEDTGFDPENVLIHTIYVPQRLYFQAEPVNADLGRVLERVQSLPGVESAGFRIGDYGPMGKAYFAPIIRKGDTADPETQLWLLCLASDDYFKTIRVPLVEGRFFNAGDTSTSPKVGIINQSFAKMYFPDSSPIGQRLIITRLARVDSSSPMEVEVVGVVRDVSRPGGGREAAAQLYVPYQQSYFGYIQLLTRTSASSPSHIELIKRQVLEVNGEFMVVQAQSLEQAIDPIFQIPRLLAITLTGFAALALLLVGVGIFGVLSYSVSRRTHEIGIRTALGAQRKDILKLIIGRGLLLTLIGIGIGLAGAFALTRLLGSHLYKVSPTDPLTFAGISLFMLATALLACYVPARRATRLDPLVALRQD